MNIYVQEFFLVSFKNIDANKMGQKWPFASFYKENMDECGENLEGCI